MLPTPILATKLYMPHTRPNLVPRPRLIKQLTEGFCSGGKLTLISAPAGFGKTTLVSEWLANLRLDDEEFVKHKAKTLAPVPRDSAGVQRRQVAWLSLDESDNDPNRFLAHVITALQQINSSILFICDLKRRKSRSA